MKQRVPRMGGGVLECAPPLEGASHPCFKSVVGFGGNAAGVGSNGFAANLAHDEWSSATAPEPERESAVAARLPGDVRIQPDEAGVSEEVEVRELANELGRQERRAPSLAGVRVVKPEIDHERRYDARAKSVAPT